jgi:hypothetical protein
MICCDIVREVAFAHMKVNYGEKYTAQNYCIGQEDVETGCYIVIL